MVKKIFLVCSAGMSTSMVVNKMRDAANNKGMEAEIKAYSISEFADVVDQYEICMVAPQIKYEFERLSGICAEKGVKCGQIGMMEYGMLNGAAVLDAALAL
ncbi:PTS sugar transporter subunit IIB [Vibrio renipiscarius]|uniref:Cytochrome C biogenesis protein CcmE n=1 Tax=Vibrio renipiscarius TaxID=1461322 RepID=A0A0C2NX27_9VIBR|nr:PTS sugar transporter subunit IIB [Vibrio renipiscarius]KII75305.1 cytochrome C biogenesis protein CcmE [Vibrio renipiscarius]KII78757.1 cytochrome C biogenesis protein CcmE [Vibrio renipiscarius]